MKYIIRIIVITTALLLFIIYGIDAQISFGGIPPSFGYSAEEMAEPAIIDIALPIDIEEVRTKARREEELWGDAPFVAKAITVNIDFAEAGKWTTLSDGTRICRLQVNAEGASALLLSYKTFHLPQGASLFLYNASRNDLAGAYTDASNPLGTTFSTEMVKGDNIILEYVSESEEMPRIEIDNVGYFFSDSPQKIGESGDCMVNINCSPEGDDWQTEKKGVCKMLMYKTNGEQGAGWYLCSGSLINNTAQDLTPYIISANHCISGAIEEDLDRWQFLFHYESVGCSNAYPENSYTLVGCYYRAATPIIGGSDGLLLELISEVPAEWDVFFNGWDRRDQIISGKGVTIHHPAGDLKKITTFNSYESGTWPGTNYDPAGATGGHWTFSSAATENGHGVTEGGSSGSPMFSKDKLIIGTLTGGSSSCSMLFGLNYYGKLWYHWDQSGSTASTQMKTWLDPLDTGVETLQGIAFNPASPRVEVDRKSLTFIGMDYVGQHSESETIVINGYNLTGNIGVSSKVPFEISADNQNWGTGLTFPPAGGSLYIRYAPEEPGVYPGTITISSAEFKEQTIELYGESCVGSALISHPGFAAHEQYYEFVLAASGSEAPYSFEITGGKLPQGLSLSTAGIISGTPGEFGTFPFTLSVSDKYGCINVIESGLYVACEIINTFPYTMHFEEESNYACLEYEQMEGNLVWEFQDGGGVGKDKKPAHAYNGSMNALLRSENEWGYATRMITPLLDFSDFSYAPELTFWHAQVNWYGGQDELRIYYRTSIFGEWKLLAEYTGNIRDWTQESILLPEQSSEYFIAFEGTGGYGYGVVLDDIQFAESDEVGIEHLHTGDAGKVWFNNPVKDECRIDWISGVNKISVYTIGGECIYSTAIHPAQQEQTILTGNWNTGIYILIIQHNEKQTAYKLIKN